MGLDYRYELYFPLASLPQALLGLAAMCVPGETLGRIRFPQGIREVPFEPFAHDPIPNWDDESYSFQIILNLEADMALEKFLAGRAETARGEDDRLNLGYLYFRVDNDVGRGVSKFVFIAGGNRMSWAFMDSTSMRSAFCRLLEAHGGLCGLLDMDEWQEVFWWRGQETWKRLENAWTLEEIDRQMRRRSRRRRL